MEQALLLNASYEPLKVVHWQKAVTLWCQGKVEVIAVHDREIRAVSVSFKLPSVIRLLRFVKIKRRFDYVPFSRANIGRLKPDLSTKYSRFTPRDGSSPPAAGNRDTAPDVLNCPSGCASRSVSPQNQ